MSIRFYCTHCGELHVEGDGSVGGTEVTCTACGRKFLAPKPTAIPPGFPPRRFGTLVGLAWGLIDVLRSLLRFALRVPDLSLWFLSRASRAPSFHRDAQRPTVDRLQRRRHHRGTLRTLPDWGWPLVRDLFRHVSFHLPATVGAKGCQCRLTIRCIPWALNTATDCAEIDGPRCCGSSSNVTSKSAACRSRR